MRCIWGFFSAQPGLPIELHDLIIQETIKIKKYRQIASKCIGGWGDPLRACALFLFIFLFLYETSLKQQQQRTK